MVYRYPMYRRLHQTWRISQLQEIHDLKDWPGLPLGAILHVWDQVTAHDGTLTYCPRLDNPIIAGTNWKLCIKNVTGPQDVDKQYAPVITNRMILTNAGLNGAFQAYKTAMSPRVLYYPSINDLPDQPNKQSIVSYNSLFRARVMGIRRKPRLLNMVLAMIVNTILKAPERMHYIHIPLEAIMFDRKDFLRIFRKYDRIATKYPECASYLILAHIYAILMKPMVLPPRGIPIEDESDPNAPVATENFDDLPAEVINKEFIDCKPEEFLTNIYNYLMEDPEFAAQEALGGLKDTENPYKLSIFEYVPPRMFERINIIFTCGGQYITYNLRDLKEINGRSGAGLFRIIKHINLLVAAGAPEEIPMEEEETVAEDVVQVDETGTKANQPEFVQPMTKDEKQQAIDQDLAELDNLDGILNATVNQEKPLTTAQREHVKVISQAYKSCTINGKTFEQLLTEIPDVSLDPPEVETEETQEGAISTQSTASSTSVLDANYVEKLMDRDLAAIVTSFNTNGMFLTEFKEETVVDDLNEKKTYVAKYEDAQHRKHVIRFSIPKVDKFGRFKDNGSYKTINKQRVSNPITKVRADRVTLNSNYNKLLVERNSNAAHSFSNWFSNALIKAKEAGFQTMLVHGACHYPIKAFPFEITEIGSKYSRINFKNGCLFFDLERRAEAIPPTVRNKVAEMEKESGVWFGYRGQDNFFMTVTGCVSVRNGVSGEETFFGAFMDFIEWLFGIQMTPMVEYSELTILSRVVPLIHPLAYRYGLTNMLKYTGCDYEVFDINARIERRTSDILLKFSDKKIVIHRNPRNNALLFGGLCIYDFSNIMLEDMDSKDVYYELLSQKKISQNLIKGIDALFDLFIDPITKDVLREMHEPTDIRDLLLRANTMLTTSEHRDEASAANFRFRGVEQITGIVYNELAKTFANYRSHAVGGSIRFSISDYQIKQRIMHEQLVENVSVINPINDIKQYSKFSNTGSGGRSNDTFMIGDRQFTPDQIGVVSEATVDNGKTGTNAMLPFNPIIVNGRGMCVEPDLSKIGPENALSLTSLLYPCVTMDDGKRANFVSVQGSHYVPIKDSDVSRVRTGFEGVVAHRCSDPNFAYSATDDGVVEKVDTVTGVMVIRFKNGQRRCLNFGANATNNSANGFYVNQDVAINGFKEGDKFRKNDVLVYNQQFFQADPYSKQVRWKIGILAKVALMDNGGTIEDASILTQPLCDRMTFNPIHVKEIVITKDTTVHAFADIGTKVMSTDPLMVFDESAMDFGLGEGDEELTSLLSDLNKSAPKAGHTGEIMKIDAFYKTPISNMSPSLQKLVKKAIAMKDAKALAAAGCENANQFNKSTPLVATDKVGIVDLTPDTVILRFYIRQDKGMSPGDKLFFDSSLKSVCSTVYPDYILTEDGQKVEACTSCRGILARIINSPFVTGLGNAVLEKLEDNIKAVWTGQEPVDQNAVKH